MDNDISKLIKETIKSIENGLPEGFEITDDIQFEVQVVTSKTSKGGMDIKLLSAGAEKQDNLTHKIKFEVSPIIDKDKKLAETLEGLENLAIKGMSVFNNVKARIDGINGDNSKS